MADKPTPEQLRIAELERQLAESRAAHEELQATKPMIVIEKPGAQPENKPRAADLHTFTDGEVKHRASGEKFKLKIDKADPLGRTHKLKNEEHFHECSEEDLRKDYDKV